VLTPAGFAAPLIAVLLAVAVAAATPAVLRRLPVPPDEVGVAPFAELGSPGFRAAVFSCAMAAGCVAFLNLEPSFWPAWAGLVSLGALLGLIDLRTGFLPLRLSHATTAAAAAGAALSAWLRADWGVLFGAAAAGALAAGFFWLVWRTTHGLGFGDVRLAALIGIVTGATGASLAFWSLLLGALVGAAWGLLVRWRRGADGPFPYGPSMLLGPVLAVGVSGLLPPG
jgi:leader peptidase (prepilin peptidase) / N-methyltransferase